MKKWFILLSSILLIIFFLFFKTGTKTASKINGIILPHHAYAKEILNLSFKRLQKTVNPETVVIFGTNHYFPISETYTTTNSVKDEFKLENVLANDERIQKDHSIQTIIPYLNEYFPKAKIVPILVSTRFVDLDYLDKQSLIFTEKFGGEKTLYIASVDFAHNVSLGEGLNKNDESINNISTFNYQEILNYHDDHMDSPVAITTLLLVMQKLNATKWETWFTSHGSFVANDIDTNGTSYVVGSFTSGGNTQAKTLY